MKFYKSQKANKARKKTGGKRSMQNSCERNLQVSRNNFGSHSLTETFEYKKFSLKWNIKQQNTNY